MSITYVYTRQIILCYLCKQEMLIVSIDYLKLKLSITIKMSQTHLSTIGTFQCLDR